MASAANEAHLKLLEEQLSRLTPGSKMYDRVAEEVKRQKRYASGEADRVGPRPRSTGGGGGGRSHGSSYGYGDPFSSGARSAWGAQWNEQRLDNEFMAKSRLATYGGVLTGLTGSLITQTAKEAEAKRPTAPNSKAHRKRRRAGRAGYAVQGAGLGMAVGPFASVGVMAVTDVHPNYTIGKATAATTAFGSALGYAYGRRAMPNNKKSKTQKQWVTYKKQSGGTIKTIRRKNPYYMKPRKARGGKKR